MAKQLLTKWIKTAYPYLKDGCGLPPWVLPERSLNRAMDQVGDSGLLKVGQTLGMADSVQWLFESEPEPAIVSPKEWQDAVKQRQSLSQLDPVITAFLEIADSVTAQFPRIRSRIDPMVICRSLAVLLYAPLVGRGEAVSHELANVLGGRADQPAELIVSYAAAVVRGDIPTLEKVNQCIIKYSDWQECVSALQTKVLHCRLKPRLIAVTPPLSTDLTGILAMMIKEGYHDESGNDPAGDSGKPVIAQ